MSEQNQAPKYPYMIVEGAGNPLPKLSPIGMLQVLLRRQGKTEQDIVQARDSLGKYTDQLLGQGITGEDFNAQLTAFIATNYGLEPNWYE